MGGGGGGGVNGLDDTKITEIIKLGAVHENLFCSFVVSVTKLHTVNPFNISLVLILTDFNGWIIQLKPLWSNKKFLKYWY